MSRFLETAAGPQVAAATPTAAVLLDLLIILVVAKLGHEVLKRLGQPGIVREEVGIVVAGIGRQTGALDDRRFGVVVGMSVLTTLLATALLRLVARGLSDPAPPQGLSGNEPT